MVLPRPGGGQCGPDHRLPAHDPTEPRSRLTLSEASDASHGVLPRFTIDGSQDHAAAIASDHIVPGTTIDVRQVRYLNNIVEQGQRAVKRIARPMRGFKSVEATRAP
jgi:transposase-like protein